MGAGSFRRRYRSNAVMVTLLLPVADRAKATGADAFCPGIVSAIDDFSRVCADELGIDGINRGEILIKIEMLRLDIEHDGVFGMID